MNLPNGQSVLAADGSNWLFLPILHNALFEQWMAGIGEWWIVVCKWTVRRSDVHVGPFASREQCLAALEELTDPRPSQPSSPHQSGEKK